MLYPNISDYKNAIVIPESFATLGNLRPENGLLGDIYFSSGNFAVVFKMRDVQTGKLHAVKCFTREQERRTESLDNISRYLGALRSPYIVPYTFLKDEIWVNDAEYPVLLMDWVDGVTLGEKVKTLCAARDTEGVHRLTVAFAEMALSLLEQDWAHGDLKHDNIMVRSRDSLALVDYDGCFVPAMSGQNAREIGSPCYRHPKRTAQHFDRHIDDFSVLVIFLSLRALSQNPDLFESHQNGENLLFSVADLAEPQGSVLLGQLRRSADIYVQGLVALLYSTLTTEGAKVLGLKEGIWHYTDNFILKPYDFILNCDKEIDFIPYRKIDSWGYCNRDKQILIPCVYDKVWKFVENLARVNKNCKYGFINKAGFEIIPCIYDDAKDYSSGFASVCRDNKYGYINVHGDEIVPLIYNFRSSSYFSQGLAMVNLNRKYGFVNEKGQEVIPCIYENAFEISEGLINVMKDNKWGFIDAAGKIVIPFIYDFAYRFSEGLARVQLKENNGFINRTGQVIIPLRYSMVDSFSEGLASVNRNGKKGYIDKNGKQTIGFIYDSVRPFSEGLALVKKKQTWSFSKTDKWGFINKLGDKISPFIYDDGSSFSEGLAKVVKDGKHGFIDKLGKQVIPCIYDSAEPFSKGLAVVINNKKYGYIDKNATEYWED